MRFDSAAAVLVSLSLLAGCGGKGGGHGRRRSRGGGGGKKIQIGFSMDTLKEERWQRDRDLVVARGAELGAEVLVQAANGNDALQNSQAENLLTQGVDVLLVAPHNGKTAATIVESAHKAGVPVIAYDRIINDSDLDLYISFDNVRVGELQADYIVKRAPKGNYVLIGGAPTDNNAVLFRKGQMNILQPLRGQGRHQDRLRPVGQGLAGGRGPEDHGERPDPHGQQGGRGGGQQRRHGGRRHPGPRRSRSWRARCRSRARTPSWRPASASWPARRA